MATGDKRTIDGLEFEFQMAPNSEAPAEMHFYVPRYKLLNLAENCTHNFHNLLPFRGADVRDALAWSKYLGEALQMWGGKADAMCGQHHWPVWGHERIDTMIRQQRDLYKFAHDQTIRLMNQADGDRDCRDDQAAGQPDGAWHARAITAISGIMRRRSPEISGWYDANPVNLDPLPPIDAGKSMSNTWAARTRSCSATRDCEGRISLCRAGREPSGVWNSDSQSARALLADTFEQPGYAAESGLGQRHLFGAQELRQDAKAQARAMPRETLAALRTGQLWDVLGVRLNGPKAEGKHIVLNWAFTDTSETFVLTLENCALTYTAGTQAATADAGFTLPRGVLDEVIAKLTSFPEAVANGKIKVSGNPMRLAELMALMDEFPRMFEIVEPKRTPVS
jgi:alkyl sulfatase BDS1-like metallo-beta-lactamase superfamily hydrolase